MKLKVLPIYQGNSGCDYHRVRLPFLCGQDYLDLDCYQKFSIKDIEHFISVSDVIVYNRSFPGGIEVLKKLKFKYDFKVVCDLDDWIELPPHHNLYQQYKQVHGPEILSNLKFADAVTVTHSRLADKVKQYNGNVHVIPNALPYGIGQFIEKPFKTTDTFRFIYAGQSSHLEDVRIMQASLNKTKSISGIGYTLAGWSDHKVWQQIEKVFYGLPHYKRQPSLPLDYYMDVYNQADCSLVPLCNNNFNWHKSNLKLLEAGAKKIPCIVSNVPPYRDDSDAPVLWVNNPFDWHKHVEALVKDKVMALEMGQQLNEWAKEKYNLLNWNRYRFELYESLIAK